jgi:four helix bundle protein
MQRETAHRPMERLEVFRRYVAVADWAWRRVHQWSLLAQDTIGKQLIRACDSVGANLVEGDGRSTDPDALRFFYTVRASAREARYWLERARERGLLSADEAAAQIAELIGATQLLNRLIAYRRASRGADRVAEPAAAYDARPTGERASFTVSRTPTDPFADDPCTDVVFAEDPAASPPPRPIPERPNA